MRVEPLDPSRHDRNNFDCGNDDLNNWLAKTANQAQERHRSSRTHVLTEDGRTILGYYSLASQSVALDAVPAGLAKGHRFPIPAVILARLAIAKDHQQQGLGERLLADAVTRALAVGLEIGVALLVVDAKDEKAVQYYERFGFVRWPTEGRKLFARLVDLAETFGVS
jgi:GNAT superfamily N-acetyltransferase